MTIFISLIQFLLKFLFYFILFSSLLLLNFPLGHHLHFHLAILRSFATYTTAQASGILRRIHYAGEEEHLKQERLIQIKFNPFWIWKELIAYGHKISNIPLIR